MERIKMKIVIKILCAVSQLTSSGVALWSVY